MSSFTERTLAVRSYIDSWSSLNVRRLSSVRCEKVPYKLRMIIYSNALESRSKGPAFRKISDINSD